MARLRYAALIGSVGVGGLTSSATSHTFGAPLTYANGTAVPTLVGVDYFLLTILAPGRQLSEVVQVTAYNSGTGVATLIRGREGSTGVAHTAGDTVTQYVYPTDFTTTALKAGSLHAIYGDDFAGASLDPKWTRVGYVSGDEQYASVGTYLQVDVARGAGSYYYQGSPPAGDFTMTMGCTVLVTGAVMFGLVALDSAGSGQSAIVYSGAPNTYLLAGVAAGAYNSSFQQGKGTLSNPFAAGQKIFYRLNRTGTAWKASASANGEIWAPWTPTVTDARTITRIGFGAIFNTPDAFAIDYFDVQ